MRLIRSRQSIPLLPAIIAIVAFAAAASVCVWMGASDPAATHPAAIAPM